MSAKVLSTIIYEQPIASCDVILDSHLFQYFLTLTYCQWV